MHGTNPIRGPVKGPGTALDIQEIYPSFQGEGPLSGEPAVFVRLGGCNLACDFCDTEFESFTNWALEEVLAAVDAAAQNAHGVIIRPLVVVTGGEPLRQPIAPLCEALLERGYRVQIETNGTLFRPLDDRVMIVCSPKATHLGYQPLREDLLERLSAIKFVMSATHTLYREVVEVGQSQYTIPVYIQPMDEMDAVKNRENFRYARKYALARGYHFSVQMHKLANAP